MHSGLPRGRIGCPCQRPEPPHHQHGDLVATFDQDGNNLTGSAGYSPFSKALGQSGINPNAG
ncbi:hypothetical protein GCM10027589_13320 [Actinocorallia lasiicapitis]